MADAQHVYEDGWGEIIDRPGGDLIELRWFDSTATMSKPEFEQWLSTFAEQVGRLRRARVLIDATSFRMNPAFMDADWRDANIIPTYHAAGVERFAFHMPEGMPMIGQPPAPEGPARFPTAYFGTRNDALQWLGDGGAGDP
jgi:hypothetical protein